MCTVNCACSHPTMLCNGGIRGAICCYAATTESFCFMHVARDCFDNTLQELHSLAWRTLCDGIFRRLEHTALISGFLLLHCKHCSILRSVGSTQFQKALRPFGDHAHVMSENVVFGPTISTELCI